MAVNENLYSWLLKTQGMPAAEWYRSNPTKPHTSNPHVPPGAAKWFPQASTGGSDKTYASAGSDIEEVSLIDDSPNSYLQALYQMPEDEYEAYRSSVGKNISRFESEDQLKEFYPGATYSQYQVPKYDNILISDYGMGFKDTGSGAHYLFNKYLEDAQGKALRDDYTNRIYPGISNTPASEAAYESLIAEANRNTQSQRTLAQRYNQLYSGKTVEGWDENAFYAEKISLPTRQNLEALIQQSEQGIDSSKQFLDDYVAKGGEGTEPKYGPRGEELGEVAVQYGDGFPKTPEWMKQLEREYNKTKGQPLRPGTPKPGRGLGDVWEGPVRDASAPQSVDVRIANAALKSDEQKQRLAQQSEFDISKEKQLASAKAADAYRRSAAAEDPFRAAARVG
jgi:hypothetical protein